MNSEDKMLLDYILSTILHMKPISGMEKIDGGGFSFCYDIQVRRDRSRDCNRAADNKVKSII